MNTQVHVLKANVDGDVNCFLFDSISKANRFEKSFIEGAPIFSFDSKEDALQFTDAESKKCQWEFTVVFCY